MSRQVAERTVSAGSRGGAWGMVALLAVGSFAIGTGAFVVSGVLGELAVDLRVSVGTAGLAITVYAAATALGTPIFSALLGGRSPGALLLGSMVVFGLTNLATAAAPTMPVLVALRAVSAVAAGLYIASAGATAMRVVPEAQRGRALAVVLSGSSVATVLGAPLGVLLAGASSWRAAFVLVAALTVVPVIGLPLAGPKVAPAPAVPLRARLAPLRKPALVGGLVVSLLAGAGSHALFTYIGPFFEPAGVPGGIGVVIAVYGVGGVLGAALGGMGADRLGGGRTVSVALGSVTVLLALSPVMAGTAVTSLAHVLLWGTVAWACVPAQQLRLVNLDPSAGPLVIALNSSAMNLGFAAGALAGGAVVDSVGSGLIWIPAAACCAASFVLHLLLSRGGGTSGPRGG